MCCSRFGFYMLFSLGILFNLTAQQLENKKDSSVFIQAVEIPAAAPQYNLVFTAAALDTISKVQTSTDESAADIIKDPTAALAALLDSLDQHPSDIPLILSICANYRQQNDQQNYNTYLQYGFKQAMKAYEEHPDRFLVVSELVEVLSEGGNYEAVMQVYERFVMTKPKHVEGLCRYAMQLILQGELEKADHLLQQAQSLEPAYAEIYLAAMMYETSKILMQLSDIMQKGLNDAAMTDALNSMRVESTFLNRAIEQYSSVPAQKALDAAQLFLVYYRTVIKAASGQLGKELIKLTATKEDLKTLNIIEKRAKKALKTKPQNTFFYYKVLTIIQVLEAKTEKAEQYWKQSGSLLKKEKDILRLLSLSHFLNLNFKAAISFLNQKQSVEYSYQDQYALCRIYLFDRQVNQTITRLKDMQSKFPQDYQIVAALAAVYFQQGQLQTGANLIIDFEQQYPKQASQDEFLYFRALASVVLQKKSDTCSILQSIKEGNSYFDSSQKIAKYFCADR